MSRRGREIETRASKLAASCCCVTWRARGTGWAAFAPVTSPRGEELFEIPNGTWARRMAGDKVEILPAQIRLTLGISDILVLRNHGRGAADFGPTLMMPGQSFRLPFAVASSYQFACTAHASGQMTIIVDPTRRRRGPGSAGACVSCCAKRGTISKHKHAKGSSRLLPSLTRDRCC